MSVPTILAAGFLFLGGLLLYPLVRLDEVPCTCQYPALPSGRSRSAHFLFLRCQAAAIPRVLYNSKF